MAKKPKHGSFYDNKGKLYVDCTECTRGHNGDDKDKCSSGWQHKKKHLFGCFLGILKSNVPREELRKLI